MKNNKYKKIAHQVIDLEIQALKKLRRSISSSFIDCLCGANN